MSLHVFLLWAHYMLDSANRETTNRMKLELQHSRLGALSYYSDLTLSQEFQPMAAQLSMKAALLLAKVLATSSCRSSKTGPWSLNKRKRATRAFTLNDCYQLPHEIGWRNKGRCCNIGYPHQHPHPSGPFYQHGLTLIPAWISNYMANKVWDEITYPFLNFNGATVEV